MLYNNLKEIKVKQISKNILESNKVILLIFYTKIFSPCIELLNLLESITINKEKVEIYIIDYDKNKDISKNFEISSLPAIVIFKNGNEIERFTGSQTKQQIETIISIIN